VMIDSLVRLLPAAEQQKMNGFPARYALVTLHRPSNVDDPKNLNGILRCLLEMSKGVEILFPIHPRTRSRIAEFGLDAPRLHLLEPLPYVEFLALQRRASVVITDSGGIQEETTYLQVPCVTIRGNTERPITVTLGTNVLVGQDPAMLKAEVQKALDGKAKRGTVPPLWDGRASERIAEVLENS